MVTFAEIETQAMELTESERATLAAHLLDSLPPVVYDDDSSVAEAMRRDAELDLDPSAGISLEEFRNSFGR